MGDYAVKQIDEMEAVFLGAFKRARAELGVESFGMQVIDLPPSYGLRGEGEIEIEGERHPLDGDHMARVGPAVKRKVWPGPEGLRILVVGGIPGKPYEPSQNSILGGPDPMAG
jgi:hypothetical protein